MAQFQIIDVQGALNKILSGLKSKNIRAKATAVDNLAFLNFSERYFLSTEFPNSREIMEFTVKAVPTLPFWNRTRHEYALENAAKLLNDNDAFAMVPQMLDIHRSQSDYREFGLAYLVHMRRDNPKAARRFIPLILDQLLNRRKESPGLSIWDGNSSVALECLANAFGPYFTQDEAEMVIQIMLDGNFEDPGHVLGGLPAKHLGTILNILSRLIGKFDNARSWKLAKICLYRMTSNLIDLDMYDRVQLAPKFLANMIDDDVILENFGEQLHITLDVPFAWERILDLWAQVLRPLTVLDSRLLTQFTVAALRALRAMSPDAFTKQLDLDAYGEKSDLSNQYVQLYAKVRTVASPLLVELVRMHPAKQARQAIVDCLFRCVHDEPITEAVISVVEALIDIPLVCYELSSQTLLTLIEDLYFLARLPVIMKLFEHLCDIERGKRELFVGIFSWTASRIAMGRDHPGQIDYWQEWFQFLDILASKEAFHEILEGNIVFWTRVEPIIVKAVANPDAGIRSGALRLQSKYPDRY